MNRVLISRILARRIGHHGRMSFSFRGYNGQAQQTSHTTYFQPPPEPPKPKRRILWTVILSATFFSLGGATAAYSLPFLEIVVDGNGDEIVVAPDGIPPHVDYTSHMTAQMSMGHVTMTPLIAEELLHQESTSDVFEPANCEPHVTHRARLPSNLPCEDGWANVAWLDPSPWTVWGIFDGHAGPKTSSFIAVALPWKLGDMLIQAGCCSRPYIPNDPHLIRTIQRAFTAVDKSLIEDIQKQAQSKEAPSPVAVTVAPTSDSGSCALVAMFDSNNSVLRVANTGDSRAVLGRWDDTKGRYVAIPLSHDHTGFNALEVERLRREHPGEDVIDPETGRIFGLAITRAFGDSRWKVSDSVQQFLHEKMWGYRPRPNGVVKTPPYLTAEPEVTETRIQTGAKPDFVIMASDGLWDKMSNDDAVLCMDQWLQKFAPTDDLSTDTKPAISMSQICHPAWPYTKIPEWTADDGPEDEDTYYDEGEKVTLWRVSPKHFVTEDSNAGMHLIKNALGGSRRSLFLRAMSVQPPMSRALRDDISVKVLFFGVDPSKIPPPPSPEMMEVQNGLIK